MAEYKIEAVNADEIIALFAKAPDIAAIEMRAGTTEALLLLERELKDEAPRGATSTLGSSIAAQEPRLLSDRVLGLVGTSIVHALPVELGTKPHFPPVEPLKDWVRAKLNVAASQVDSVAFLIARKISKKGTEAQPFFKETFNANKGQIETIFTQSATRIIDKLSHV